MEWIIKEYSNEFLGKKTAESKPRIDIYDISMQMGIKEIAVHAIAEDRSAGNYIKKIMYHKVTYDLWQKIFEFLEAGDICYIQFPLINHTIFFSRILKKMLKKKINIVLWLHDVEALRYAQVDGITRMRRRTLLLEEKSVLKFCSCIIVHNERMLSALEKTYRIPSERMVVLEIFDYLLKDLECKESAKDKPFVIAGNLQKEKAGYIYNLPLDLSVNLYGPNYEVQEKQHISYKGAFFPDELPKVLDGSFGIVWDGRASDMCEGSYGNYLKYNAPHKLSLYIASGLPVIVWRKSAMLDFVEKYGIGMGVESLYEVSSKLVNMSENDYLIMKENVKNLQHKIQTGYFTRKVIENVRKRLGN